MHPILAQYCRKARYLLPLAMLLLMACGRDVIVVPASPTPELERCDGLDNDRDAQVDEDFDLDGDSYVTGSACASLSPLDCNDADVAVHPNASEICGNGLDDDCIGGDQLSTLWYADNDGDGVGIDSLTVSACGRPDGYSSLPGDCDDTDSTLYPGAPEAANGQDSNCDGAVSQNVSIQQGGALTFTSQLYGQLLLDIPANSIDPDSIEASRVVAGDTIVLTVSYSPLNDDPTVYAVNWAEQALLGPWLEISPSLSFGGEPATARFSFDPSFVGAQPAADTSWVGVWQTDEADGTALGEEASVIDCALEKGEITFELAHFSTWQVRGEGPMLVFEPEYLPEDIVRSGDIVAADSYEWITREWRYNLAGQPVPDQAGTLVTHVYFHQPSTSAVASGPRLTWDLGSETYQLFIQPVAKGSESAQLEVLVYAASSRTNGVQPDQLCPRQSASCTVAAVQESDGALVSCPMGCSTTSACYSFDGDEKPDPFECLWIEVQPDLDPDDDHDGYSEQQGDCNDQDASINPGAELSCDGGDSNCDGREDVCVTPTPTPEPETPTPTPTPIPATPTLPPSPPSCSELPDRSITEVQTDASLVGKRVRISGVLITTPLTPEENSGGQGFYTQEVPDVDNGGLRMQADSGTLGAIQQGKIVTFCGEVGEERSNTYLAVNPADITIESDGTLPTPAVVDACTLATSGEVYEGRLVQVVDVTTTNPSSGNSTFTVEDCLQVGTEFFSFQAPPYPMPEQPFKSITGVVRQVGEGNYRIQPRTLEDMVQALFSYADPNSTSFTNSVTVQLKANVSDATIHYTLDGSEPSLTSDSMAPDVALTFYASKTLKFFAVSTLESESVVHTELYERLDSVGSILISEVAVQGSDQEFIEIHNPTDGTVDLSQYYLTDLSNPDSTTGEMDNDFTRITTNSIKGNANDFLAKFPEGTLIRAGQRLVIILGGGDAFTTVSGVTPDFEVVDKSTTIPNMVLFGPPASQVGTSNSAEFVLLFTWDGTSKLVQDIDYFRWSNSSTSNTGVNRTGLVVGGEGYQADTALFKTSALQSALPGHSNGQSMCRKGISEGDEVQSGGNGVGGADETSESFQDTWELCVYYTPGR